LFINTDSVSKTDCNLTLKVKLVENRFIRQVFTDVFILIIAISQGSVAMQLKCGGIFNYYVTANLPQSAPVKEFLKSVNI